MIKLTTSTQKDFFKLSNSGIFSEKSAFFSRISAVFSAQNVNASFMLNGFLKANVPACSSASLK